MSKKQRFFRFLSKKLTFSKCFGYIIRKETAEVYFFQDSFGEYTVIMHSPSYSQTQKGLSSL